MCQFAYAAFEHAAFEHASGQAGPGMGSPQVIKPFWVIDVMDLAELPRSLADNGFWAKYIKELKPLCIV
jgi:hypothetical protein